MGMERQPAVYEGGAERDPRLGALGGGGQPRQAYSEGEAFVSLLEEATNQTKRP